MKKLSKMKLLLLLLLSGLAFGQAPEQSFDKKIVPSDFFSDEYPNENICSIKVANAEDVATLIDGGCLKYRASDQMFFGGQCGTGGGSGFDFDSGSPDQQHSWLFPIGQKPLTASINFTTAGCPQNWGTNCWSAEPRAIVGSFSSVNGGSPPSDVVLLSNQYVAYSSASDKRAVAVWVGSTKYPVNPIAVTKRLGVRDVIASSLKTQIPGTNWQGVRFEFSDGSFSPSTVGTLAQKVATKEDLISYLGLQSFSPSQDNIYPATKAILKAGSNISIAPSDSGNTLTISSTASGGGGGATVPSGGPSELLALDSAPSDLSSYKNNQIIPLNTPSPGKFVEVQGSSTQHGYGINGAIDPNNANNWGASYFGDVYGSLSTEEGGQPLSAAQSAVQRFEVTQNTGGDDTLTVLIRKTDLTNAPATIYYRIYQKPVGEAGDELATGSLTKGTDNPAHTYHTYLSPDGDGTANLLWSDTSDIKYVRFFTANPATDDETSNPLNLHSEKSLADFSAEPAEWARVGQPRPIGAVPSQRFTVQRTQRITGFGGTRFIDKNTAFAGLPNDLTFPLTKAYLDGDALFFITNKQTLSDRTLSSLKFFLIEPNSDATDFTMSEVTLDVGVTLPSSFSLYGHYIHQTHDNKVLVIGGHLTSLSNSNDNNDVFILTINKETKKITNIRTLSSQLNLSFWGTSNVDSVYIDKRSNGDFIILYALDNSSSSSSSSAIRAVRLVIGDNLDRITTLITNYNFLTVCQIGSRGNAFYSILRPIVHTNHTYYPLIGRCYNGIRYSWEKNLLKIQNSNYSAALGSRATLSGTNWNSYFLNTQNINGDWLLDGTYLRFGYRYNANFIMESDLRDDTSNVIASEVSGLTLPTTRTQVYTPRLYRSDFATPGNSQYNVFTMILENGNIFDLNIRTLYGGGTSVIGYKLTAATWVDVQGTDVQTVISRRLLDSATFDTANAVYIRDELKTLTGANKLSMEDLFGYEADSLDTTKAWKMAVEETTPGTKQDKNLAFTASGSTFTTTNPFPGILRLTYNNLSTDTDTYQRYTAFVPLASFNDDKAPHVLKLGSVNYSFSYLQTESNQAVYVTSKVATADRITSASTKNNVNIQYADNSWAGMSSATKAVKTVDKDSLSSIVNAPRGVHRPPSNPVEGTRIEMLNDFTVQGGAVLTAQESHQGPLQGE